LDSVSANGRFTPLAMANGLKNSFNDFWPAITKDFFVVEIQKGKLGQRNCDISVGLYMQEQILKKNYVWETFQTVRREIFVVRTLFFLNSFA